MTRLEPAAAIDAGDLWPLDALEALVQRSHSGAQVPATVSLRIERIGPDRWRMDLAGVRSAVYRLAKSGTILIEEETEVSDAAVVRYSPAIELLPARLAMGRRTSGTAHMEVTNLHDGSVRDTGSCTYEIELIGKQPVDAAGAVRDAHVVRTTRSIDLQLAKARVVTETAYVPGFGWVAERVSQTLWPLGLFEAHKSETLRRVR